MTITLAGNGSWGKALQSLLEENGHAVSLLPKDEPLPATEVLILAIPTQAIRPVLRRFAKKDKTLVVNSAKGMEQRTHAFPFVIAEEEGVDTNHYFSLMGPSFAQEVIGKMPTVVNLGYTNKKKATIVRDLFQTSYFEVQLTKEVEVLELAGALKNIYAIACGIASGLGFGMNTRTKLILSCLHEIHTLAAGLGYELPDKATPGILGDLLLTCNSTKSRNFTFGELLVHYPAKEALEQINATVEGYHTAQSILFLAQKAGKKLPIALFVKEALILTSETAIRKAFLRIL